MSRRHKQLAAGAGGLVLAIVLVAVLTNGGSDRSPRDRAEIAAVALAYEQAIAANTNPCSYLDPQSRAFAMAQVKRELLGAHPCAAVA